MRYLIQVRLVTASASPARAATSTRLHHDLWYEAIVNREPLLSRWQPRAGQEGVDAVGADTPAGRRLTESAEFFSLPEVEMPAMLARWREHRRP